MSADRYQLLREAGLDVRFTTDQSFGPADSDVVTARSLLSWLERALVVYGHYDGSVFWAPDPKLGLKSGTATPDTHTARLVCIQPIVRDTAEGLLRELCSHSQHDSTRVPAEFIDRCRRLLGEG